MKTKLAPVYWTPLEYYKVFIKYQTLIKYNTETGDFFEKVMVKLDVKRRKKPTPQLINKIKLGFILWKENKHPSYWWPYVATKALADFRTHDLTETYKYWEKQIADYEASVVLKRETPSKKSLRDKLRDISINNPVEIKLSGFARHLSEFYPTADALNKIEKSVKEFCIPSEVQNPVLLTEGKIRSIVRGEIEKIFGAIDNEQSMTTKPVVIEETKQEKTPFVYVPSAVTEPTVPESEASDQDVKKPIIFIFGIKKQFINLIRKSCSKDVIIRGEQIYNDSAKNQSKNSDHVIVSKWSCHSDYETFRNDCGIKNVTFVSGGMTMIKNTINKLAESLVTA